MSTEVEAKPHAFPTLPELRCLVHVHGEEAGRDVDPQRVAAADPRVRRAARRVVYQSPDVWPASLWFCTRCGLVRALIDAHALDNPQREFQVWAHGLDLESITLCDLPPCEELTGPGDDGIDATRGESEGAPA